MPCGLQRPDGSEREINQPGGPEAGAADRPGTDDKAQQPRLLTSVPEDLPDGLMELLQRVQKERKRPLLVLVARDIDDSVCHDLYSWRTELREAGKEGNLDVLIHSPGGELQACYVVARMLSRYTSSWEALVPREAASGATLICLGSSKVVMPDIARLGPLDPQVLSKRTGKFFATERQSPLEAFQAMKYLQQFCLTSLDIFMLFLLRQGLDAAMALKSSGELAGRLVSTPLQKVEPYDLGAFALDSDVAKQCCGRVLRSTAPDRKTQRRVKPETLVELYPTHSFVIDREEAEEIGFEVSPPPQVLEPIFEEVAEHLKEVEKLIGLVPAA